MNDLLGLSLLILGLALAAGAQIAVATTRTLRLDVEGMHRSPLAIGARVAAVAVLASGAVISLLAAAGLAFDHSSPPALWNGVLGVEPIALVGIAVVIRFAESESGRGWLLLGAMAAGGLTWASATWLGDSTLLAVPTPVSAALAAAALCTLLLSSGPTARLVARIRRAATQTAGDHLLVVDSAGRLRYATDAGRAVVGLQPRAKVSRGAPDVLPKRFQDLLQDPKRRRGRFRAASGLILEAWVTEPAKRGLLSRARGVLVRDVTERYRDERRLVRLAHFDSLTGLPNRRHFLETLTKVVESAGQASHSAALFYLDLDEFKAINDSLGHGAGDTLLKTLAERFGTYLRHEQVAQFGVSQDAALVVARLAGDEFAVIAPRLPNDERAYDLARWILDLVRRPLELADRTVSPSASIGIAFFPEDGGDVETLIRHADAALYVAKSRGRRRFVRYEASFDAKADRARLLEDGLRCALERDQMRLFYQPKVDVLSGTVVGFEALLRWKSPELGDVGPAEFIPVAEERGLVTELGTWCLNRACRQIQEWRDGGLAIVPVSVNVSSAQFAESDLQRIVSDALKAHEVEPRHLELELTESLLLDPRDHVEPVLRDLRAIGVRIALDDFGTGYSALTYLNRFSLDVLKMDRGLLRDIDSNPSALGIASAVVAMAHSLDLTVVAEGVDLEEQVPLLREMGCDQIQGFLFAPALPADEVVRFMPRVGEPAPAFGPGMSAPGRRLIAAMDSLDHSDDEGEFREAPASLVDREGGGSPTRDRGRALLVDDDMGTLGPVAMRLMDLGVDVHYATAVDEARLFIAQEGEVIRLVAASPSADLSEVKGLIGDLTERIGEPRLFVVIGERPDETVRAEIRDAGVDWVLWAPFSDSQLRYLVKNAMALPQNFANQRELRVPVDLVATLRCGQLREVAVVSSLSPRGAFIETSNPLPVGSSLRIEIDLPQDHFRGFARVVHVEAENSECLHGPSGMGVTFFGIDRDVTRILRKAVKELEAPYLP